MKCIVVDDEMPARDEIIYLLKEIRSVEVIGEANNGESALILAKNTRPDIIFLDINMRGMDGFDVVNEILKMKHRPFIVFVTAYDQYAIKAFEVSAIDYILKPIKSKRLEKTIERIENLLVNNIEREKAEKNISRLIKKLNPGKEKVNKICVYDNGKYIPLSPQEILFITTIERNTIIRSKIGEFSVNLTLSEMEEKLAEYNFFRTHRSYLVNLDEVKEIHNWFNGTFQIVLNGVDDVKVAVSRNKSSEFKHIMNI